jgi:hypothetical protein
VACYEVFTCSYKKAKKVISYLKNELPEEFSKEVEVKNAEKLFDFEDINTSSALRKRNINSDNKTINTAPPPKSDESTIRRSEFIDELNQIQNPEFLEIESIEMQKEGKVTEPNAEIKDFSDKEGEKGVKKPEPKSEPKILKANKSTNVDCDKSIKVENKQKKQNFNYFKVIFWIILVLIILSIISISIEYFSRDEFLKSNNSYTPSNTSMNTKQKPDEFYPDEYYEYEEEDFYRYSDGPYSVVHTVVNK